MNEESGCLMSKMKITKLFIRLLIVSSFTVLFAAEFSFGPSSKDFSSLNLSGISIVKINSKESKLELKKRETDNSELFFDFENKAASDLKDKSGRYTVHSASYIVQDSMNPSGKKCAVFSGRNNFIRVETNKSLLFGSTFIRDHFYISLSLQPGETENSATIIYKNYLSEGKKFGLTMDLVDNKIVIFFDNLFYSKSGETFSFIMKSSDRLNKKSWNQILLTYDPEESILTLAENGKETSRVKTIRKSKDMIEPLSFGFHNNDSTPLYIGKNFYGKLDDFSAGKGKPEKSRLIAPYDSINYDEQNLTTHQNSGSAISRVIQTRFSNSKPLVMNIRMNEPEGTYAEVFLRFSRNRFVENGATPGWITYEKFSESPKKEFQFFQWMVKMRSDNAGLATPDLRHLSLMYMESLPPETPTGLRVLTRSREGLNVCLGWNSNHEANVKENGGYIIHYGTSRDRIVGSIFLNKDKGKITGLPPGKKLAENYMALEQCIDNDVISLNSEPGLDLPFLKNKQKNEGPGGKMLPFFRKGITYYFRISAYNSNYNSEESIDQRSKPSAPVLHSFSAEIPD